MIIQLDKVKIAVKSPTKIGNLFQIFNYIYLRKFFQKAPSNLHDEKKNRIDLIIKKSV